MSDDRHHRNDHRRRSRSPPRLSYHDLDNEYYSGKRGRYDDEDKDLDYGIGSKESSPIANEPQVLKEEVQVRQEQSQVVEEELHQDEPLFMGLEEDEEAEIERRRKRRQEILRKYNEDSSRPNDDSKPFPNNIRQPSITSVISLPPSSVPSVDDNDSFPSSDTPENVPLNDVQDKSELNEEGAVAAADYDPNRDEAEDERKHQQAILDKAYKHPIQQAQKESVAEKELDMFADDIDMFAPQQSSRDETTAVAPVLGSQIMCGDVYRDADGYYRTTAGELLNEGRYELQSLLGKGVFSTVVRARDRQESRDVAIKIIRYNEMMHRAGQKEFNLLERLQEQDPDGRRHIIRMFHSFEHRGHLCIVFESMR